MRPGIQGELILEGELEARIAGHFLLQHDYGKKVLGLLQPKIEKPHIGRLEFLGRRILGSFRGSDTTEYVIYNPDNAAWAARAIAVTSIPGNILSPIPKVLSRQRYLGERVRKYYLLQQEMDLLEE